MDIFSLLDYVRYGDKELVYKDRTYKVLKLLGDGKALCSYETENDWETPLVIINLRLFPAIKKDI